MAYLSRDDRRRADRQGYLMIGGCVVMLGALAGGVMVMRPPALDAATGCIKGQVASVHELVVVDVTDPISAPVQALLSKALARLMRDIRVQGRVAIFSFDGKADAVPVALLDKCRPPYVEEINQAFVTVSKAERDFEASFGEPVRKVLEATLTQTTSANAAETNLVAYLGNLAASVKYQRTGTEIVLHVWSDMLENSTSGTFFPGRKKTFDNESFKTHFRSLVGDRLDGVRLEIHEVPTAASAPFRRRVKEAWSGALTAQGIRFSWKGL